MLTFLQARRGELLQDEVKSQLCGMVLCTTPPSLLNCHVVPKRGWNYTETKGANNYDRERAGHGAVAERSWKRKRKGKGALSVVTGLHQQTVDLM